MCLISVLRNMSEIHTLKHYLIGCNHFLSDHPYWVTPQTGSYLGWCHMLTITWGGTTYFNVKYSKYFLRPVLHMATNAIWSTGRVKYFNYFVAKYLMPPQVHIFQHAPHMLMDLCAHHILSEKGNLLMYLLADWMTKINMLPKYIHWHMRRVLKDIVNIWHHPK